MVLSGLPLGIDLQQILLHLVNFAVLFVGLYILLYKPVKDFMDKREAHYKSLDEEKETALSEAKAKEAEVAKRLAACDEEVDRIRQEALDKLSEERIASEKTAKQAAEKLIEDAKKEAETARANILAGAEKDIAELLGKAAEKLMVAGDTGATYDAFLEEAERSLKDGKQDA